MAKVINAPVTTGYEQQLDEVANALRGGALVVFPTETVYGVAANAANPDAMARLRGLKGRQDGQPFTVHLGRPAEVFDYVDSPSPLLRRLVRKAWPGPLTVVAHTDPSRTRAVSANPDVKWDEIFHHGTVGLRCPDHEVAEYILSGAGAPVVASSANRAGMQPPRDARHAMDELADVDYVVDSGPARFGAASTVIEVNGNQWKMLREGRIDERTLRRMEKSEILFVCTGNSCRSPMAAALFRHKLAQRLGKSIPELEHQGYYVHSAGTCAAQGGPASAGALEALDRRGIDLSSHRSSPVMIDALLSAERVFAMSPEHRAALLDLAPGVAHKVQMLDPDGPIADPLGGGPEVYERCAAQLERAVERRLEEYLNENRDWQ